MSYSALPILRTPRLSLQPLRDQDADALVEGIGNFDVSKWLAVVPYPYRRADAVSFISRVREENRLVWGIWDNAGLQGVVGIEQEFGFWLARPVWRRGYGFEAAQAVVGHWFADQANDVLSSGHFTGNARSGEVLRAIGFVETGKGERFARSLNQSVPSSDVVLTRRRWAARQDFTLSTVRLTIRPMERRDAPSLAAMAVPEVARNMSTIPLGMTDDAARAYVDASRFRGLPGFRLAIERDGRMIGGLGFGGTPLGIAYFLAPELWGQGLASEALAAFLPELFERFPVNRIGAEHFEDNPASGAVLRKFGFAETGRGMGHSKARLEPAPVITYAVTREMLRVQP